MSKLVHVAEAPLRAAVLSLLARAGADDASAEGTARALLHASRVGVDSHGVRLVGYYAPELRAGRINGRPNRTIRRTAAATAVVDADHGLGHAAAYEAVALACDLAATTGVGAVTVARSSHFGAAGAYALAAAERGMIGVSATNSESLVALHGGAAAFHGTNPIAAAAPVAGQDPWLLDMATSSIPFNRVLLYRTLGRPLPPEVAADEHGSPTTDAAAARMLMPVGGADFGFKGAALAGLATILSAALAGATLDHDFPAEVDVAATVKPARPESGTGHFLLAIDPDKFVGRPMFEAAMARYVDALRASPAVPGAELMAPGDREWRVRDERAATGIPVDHETAALLGL